MRYIHHLQILIAGVILASCSTTKYVPDGSFLLDKVEVKADGSYRDIDLAGMNSYVRQKANSRWFSAWKLALATYSLSGRDTTKWINRMLRSIGEPPVIYDSLRTQRSVTDLQAELQNRGYLSARVEMDTLRRGKKINTQYTLHPGERYYINSMRYDIRDSVISVLLCMDDTLNWGIRPGKYFTVETLDGERKRITRHLTNHGYYRFNKDYISYQADTIGGSKGIDLTLVLHPYISEDVTDMLHPCYSIGKVTYINGDDVGEEISLRPSVLRANSFLEEGERYSAEKLQRTYNHYGRLGAVRYTNISFREREHVPVVDCDLLVSMAKPHTITFQPEGTNTAGDLGAAASLIYQNRNLFKGSELLSIELRGAFEAIRGLEGYNNDNFEEYSIETSLAFPRFIVPFLSQSFRRRTIAESEISLMYDLQNRPEYHRRVLSAAWRYKWNDPRHHDKYRIDLIEVNYISMPWISGKFRMDYLEDDGRRNAILRYNYEDQFIMKFGGVYTYNNGTHAIRASAETAGNLLSAITDAFDTEQNALGQRMLFRIAYAQYAKADISYTRNITMGYNSTLVLHADLGVAYPYGNSTILPFEKRYFSGGANSVRGWGVRELGPGRYVARGEGIDFINQTGDIRLNLNMEYRAHLFWKLGGAVFVDAGNIWTLRSYDDQPGGQFHLNEFWKQIAASYGVGLRLNFDYFILRFDFGMKAVNPVYVDTKEQFPIISPRFSRDFAFHFAVGMPF